ncbi:hypothetical protein TVAG_360920 [Trichomonas vaginalis G3]|uniref:Uncharacterized protein n=1 Tax=Trichomonas vaginalis (strain ATCC PRA-98 / G3) TaxID=412133 RepID=A2FGP9_TRIV3|nr:hypothetical protein TVAGG3_0031650 [Trichomonas vaginalis G3]EAX95931.1 hypothetical protein TVAG_360920 [Trichomonas vaginalis G3]KAI5540139.1 hypothetical protein TVAGG3_0031650 [Trichomonas vaginalis G3]|eukprot:XP_001308861.1 hypothetical protein [Trichomonas vaginalis G3]
MAAILIACAIISCLASAVKIVQSFKTEVIQNPITSGHGKGFWDFCSFSSVDSMTIRYERGPNYVNNYLIPSVIGKSKCKKVVENKQEIVDYLNALVDNEGYEFEAASKSLTAIVYNKATLEMFMWIYTFTPVTINQKSALRIESMRLELYGCRLAADWTLYNTVTSSMLKMKNVVEVQYKDAAISPDKIVDAMAIAFAPVYFGIIRVPSGFLDVLKDAVKKSIDTPTELPGSYTPEQMKYSEAQYNAMIERQKQRDAQAIEGIKEIGDAVAKLGK